jgi:hypothetical protein
MIAELVCQNSLEGFAGSTKTTTVGAVREFAEQKG